MTAELDPDAPLVVGALGGSGTRVLGDLLIGAGVHLGGSLNTANDSVTATTLFNRPQWAAKASGDEIEAVFRRLRRFLLRRDVSLSDYGALLSAAMQPGHTEGARRRLRYVRRIGRERGPGSATLWGWKEPNSHLFLPDLARTFPGLRFVYLARHPLDMAFSTNLNQLRNWAWRLGIEVENESDAEGLARGQLDLWIRATREAITAGSDLLGDRFLHLRFDELVDEPTTTVDRLARLAGATLDDATRRQLASLPQRPSSDGRHLDRDLGTFRPEQIDAVRELWGEF